MGWIILFILLFCLVLLFLAFCAKMTEPEKEKYDKELLTKFLIEKVNKSILSDSEQFNKLVDELYQLYKEDYSEFKKRIENYGKSKN